MAWVRRLTFAVRAACLAVATAGLLTTPNLAAVDAGASPYAGWRHSRSCYILTTPEGANLPLAASEIDFPLLVRLDAEFFDFSEAKTHGADVRFATGDGVPLRYQIEEWDATNGTASIWVRIPMLKGNARQELRVYWGKPDAASESSGADVFDRSNGYVSVWHMAAPVRDETGTVIPKDVGTSPTRGMIGEARHFAAGQGMFGGDKITSFPSGVGPMTTEAWFRAEKPNATVLAWGKEQRPGKVMMNFLSPPRVAIQCYFADVEAKSALALNRWYHVVHTYESKDSRVYVNGELDGVSTPLLDIPKTVGLWLGGWYHDYRFVGDLDEVRTSEVVRSADWVKLEYENQKPMQTLVGPLVQPGLAFSISPPRLQVAEGRSATLSAQAGGAQKVYWIVKRGGEETVAAVDRFHFTLEAGRVVGDQSCVVRFKAIYADGVKTVEVPVTIQEDIPDPVFVLKAPATWDGRTRLELKPEIANLPQMQAKGAGALHYAWSVPDFAVIKEASPGMLMLKRAQNTGRMTITLAVDNGGTPTVQSATIQVQEPKSDPWVQRPPSAEEMPEENQFYARDEQDEGTLHCNGTATESADAVFLKVYAGGELYQTARQTLSPERKYAVSVKLHPGLIEYKAEFGVRQGGQEKVLRTANHLVCGDAYLIDGQSNAEATSWGNEAYPFSSEWIRSYGTMEGSPEGARTKLWGNAVARGQGGKLQVGYWGMELARRLVEDQKVPICIINGAVGGTRIDQHQRNPAEPEDVGTIYGRLLWRVEQARLTHGIRGVLWHQGENDQGADGPTGGFGWETYQQYFIELAGAWKQDYPNIQHYYVFQIWPKSCAMGVHGSDNRLREVQRTLPRAFSHLSVMSTLGIDPPGTCHYPPAGYAEIARLVCPLVERDNYGLPVTASITPPDLRQAWFADPDKQDEILLEFDQPVAWDNSLVSQFYLDGAKGRVTSGSVSGNLITLKLAASSTAKTITYLDSNSWSQDRLLRGQNGLAALTFCEVPIRPGRPAH